MMKHKLTADRLNEALNEANMTAQELSKKSGVSKASISQYRHGTYKPSNVSSGKMGEVLGVNPLWLMGYDVDKYEMERPFVITVDKKHYDLFAGVNDFAERASRKNIEHLISYMNFIIAQQEKEDNKQ